jgi:hypothetical protein
MPLDKVNERYYTRKNDDLIPTSLPLFIGMTQGSTGQKIGYESSKDDWLAFYMKLKHFCASSHIVMMCEMYHLFHALIPLASNKCCSNLYFYRCYGNSSHQE